jgi:hypothetical protein
MVNKNTWIYWISEGFQLKERQGNKPSRKARRLPGSMTFQFAESQGYPVAAGTRTLY